MSDEINEAEMKKIFEAALPEAEKRAKALAWARKVVNCLGTKKLESWFMANYIYYLNKGRPFGSIDYAHVYAKDDEIVVSLVSKVKSPKKSEYLPLEHLLVLQDVMNVQVELNVSDEKLKRKIVNTLKTIEKFPAKKGKVRATWRWNEEVDTPSLLKKKVRQALEEIQEKAKRLGCFQALKKVIS